MVVGMATGAVLGAAGAMMATQSKRQMRRNVRKVTNTFSNICVFERICFGF